MHTSQNWLGREFASRDFCHALQEHIMVYGGVGGCSSSPPPRSSSVSPYRFLAPDAGVAAITSTTLDKLLGRRALASRGTTDSPHGWVQRTIHAEGANPSIRYTGEKQCFFPTIYNFYLAVKSVVLLRACLKARRVRAPGLHDEGFALESCRPGALTRRPDGVFKQALRSSRSFYREKAY